jgi:dTDP-4-dehydrorhamnose 3,5-epimerase
MINDVIITPLDIIDGIDGGVMHAMKKSDDGYNGFGEAYFSNVKYTSIKAWKRHKEMTLNLIVPTGKIRFVLYDDRVSGAEKFQEIIISKSNYCRLTVPPMVWVGFQGLSKNGSTLLNVANIEHNPNEADKKGISGINFDWS